MACVPEQSRQITQVNICVRSRMSCFLVRALLAVSDCRSGFTASSRSCPTLPKMLPQGMRCWDAHLNRQFSGSDFALNHMVTRRIGTDAVWHQWRCSDFVSPMLPGFCQFLLAANANSVRATAIRQSTCKDIVVFFLTSPLLLAGIASRNTIPKLAPGSQLLGRFSRWLQKSDEWQLSQPPRYLRVHVCVNCTNRDLKHVPDRL